MAYCSEHNEMAISCSKIGEMHDDIKAIREDMKTYMEELHSVKKKVAVHEERWDNAKWIIGMIVVSEMGLITAVLTKYIGG